MADAIDRATVFKGECLLLRWGESQKGRTVTLQLDPDVTGDHPFKGLKCGENGQRVMVAAVLIADDETPQATPAQAEAPARSTPTNVSPIKQGKRFSELPRSQQAALKLQDNEFCEWLYEKHRADVTRLEQQGRIKEGGLYSEYADTVLKVVLNIISKTDLDTYPQAGANWSKMLTTYETESRYGIN